MRVVGIGAGIGAGPGAGTGGVAKVGSSSAATLAFDGVRVEGSTRGAATDRREAGLLPFPQAGQQARQRPTLLRWRDRRG